MGEEERRKLRSAAWAIEKERGKGEWVRGAIVSFSGLQVLCSYLSCSVETNMQGHVCVAHLFGNAGALSAVYHLPSTIHRMAKTSPEQSARRAGLVYVSDDEAGIRRIGRGKGFSYHLPDDTLVEGDRRDEIEQLAIPPAWSEVWICTDPQGHLQATGARRERPQAVPLPPRLGRPPQPLEVRPDGAIRRSASGPPGSRRE